MTTEEGLQPPIMRVWLHRPQCRNSVSESDHLAPERVASIRCTLGVDSDKSIVDDSEGWFWSVVSSQDA